MLVYLLLNIFTISYPLYASRDKRVNFYKRWPALFPAIFISGALFIVWDHYFVQLGVWNFNPEYLVGIYIFDLPLEEWLFFLTVPFACAFIYEVIRYFFPSLDHQHVVRPLTLVLALTLLVLAVVFWKQTYTTVTFTLCGGLLLFHYFRRSAYMCRFYVAYLFHLIPFLIVNGVLTYLPVVRYNNDHNLGLRIGSIPVEDSIYSMLLLLLIITVYEHLLVRQTNVVPKNS